MMNLAALGGIQNWAPLAEAGLPSLSFLLLGILFFFLPVSLVSSELATTWPGGIYEWVGRAFGHRVGFFSIWLLWVQNLLYYPMMLSFIVGTISFVFWPDLMEDKVYIYLSILSIFWAVTFANLKGFDTSKWISVIGAICGTFIPGIFIVGLGSLWWCSDPLSHKSLSFADFIPKLNPNHLPSFIGSIFALVGIEMSAIHASPTENPRRGYARAIFFSALFVVLFSLLGVLSIALVIPKSEILLNTAALQAFEYFTQIYSMELFLPFIALVMTIGSIGSMSTWMVGPCMGLVSAAKGKDLPFFLRKIDQNGKPKSFLLLQALIVSVISLFFLFSSSMNSFFWFCLILSTQFYLLMYVILFASAIKLRYTHPEVHRPFKLPGKMAGMWIVALLGGGTSLIAILSSFFLKL